jgi:hypothetical protein
MHLLSEDLQRVFPRDPALGFRYPDVGNAHYADLVTGCRIFQPCSLVQSNFRVLPLLSRGRAYAALLRHPVIKSLIQSVSSCGEWAWHVVRQLDGAWRVDVACQVDVVCCVPGGRRMAGAWYDTWMLHDRCMLYGIWMLYVA